MKTKLQLLFLGLLGLSSISPAQSSISKWQAQPIVIDGDRADWVNIPRFFDSSSNVQYEFRNDDKNLYLIVRTTDRAAQMQMLRGGFALKLKVKTKIPTRCSITFPALKMEMPPQQFNKKGDESQILLEKTAPKPGVLPKDSVVLDGFKFSNGAISSENKDENKICFARNKETREQLIYELRVPICEIYGKDFVLEDVVTLPIQLQITINELSQNSGKQDKGGKGMRGGGGMRGGMQGGGMRGGMPGGGGMQGGPDGGGGMPGEGEMSERPQFQNNAAIARKTINDEFSLSKGK
ncbi:MAG: hypothetical protein JZU53_01875 [Paludibacter sp.]|nr:hypothetical protein [Paludibacter sp.]